MVALGDVFIREGNLILWAGYHLLTPSWEDPGPPKFYTPLVYLRRRIYTQVPRTVLLSPPLSQRSHPVEKLLVVKFPPLLGVSHYQKGKKGAQTPPLKGPHATLEIGSPLGTQKGKRVEKTY